MPVLRKTKCSGFNGNEMGRQSITQVTSLLTFPEQFKTINVPKLIKLMNCNQNNKLFIIITSTVYYMQLANRIITCTFCIPIMILLVCWLIVLWSSQVFPKLRHLSIGRNWQMIETFKSFNKLGRKDLLSLPTLFEVKVTLLINILTTLQCLFNNLALQSYYASKWRHLCSVLDISAFQSYSFWDKMTLLIFWLY